MDEITAAPEHKPARSADGACKHATRQRALHPVACLLWDIRSMCVSTRATNVVLYLAGFDVSSAGYANRRLTKLNVSRGLATESDVSCVTACISPILGVERWPYSIRPLIICSNRH